MRHKACSFEVLPQCHVTLYRIFLWAAVENHMHKLCKTVKFSDNAVFGASFATMWLATSECGIYSLYQIGFRHALVLTSLYRIGFCELPHPKIRRQYGVNMTLIIKVLSLFTSEAINNKGFLSDLHFAAVFQFKHPMPGQHTRRF